MVQVHAHRACLAHGVALVESAECVRLQEAVRQLPPQGLLLLVDARLHPLSLRNGERRCVREEVITQSSALDKRLENFSAHDFGSQAAPLIDVQTVVYRKRPLCPLDTQITERILTVPPNLKKSVRGDAHPCLIFQFFQFFDLLLPLLLLLLFPQFCHPLLLCRIFFHFVDFLHVPLHPSCRVGKESDPVVERIHVALSIHFLHNEMAFRVESVPSSHHLLRLLPTANDVEWRPRRVLVPTASPEPALTGRSSGRLLLLFLLESSKCEFLFVEVKRESVRKTADEEIRVMVQRAHLNLQSLNLSPSGGSSVSSLHFLSLPLSLTLKLQILRLTHA
mmetsp:Transcript_46615/g.92055  ORF Transcript_46615/g.92055 Transcript_46615/m.92055 type:complete len:335 (-) Transcript_46615:427-1431(-)